MTRNPLIPLARTLRKSMTKPEVLLWIALRNLKPNGFRFRRKVPLLGYIVDFAYHHTKIVVEVDGFQHGFEANLAADRERDEALATLGFIVLRFTNDDVMNNRDGVMESILREASKHSRCFGACIRTASAS